MTFRFFFQPLLQLTAVTVLFAAVATAATGCGYSSINNQTLGQPKRLHQETPLICGPFTDLDLSLGVMRNGVGSMSPHDELFYVPNKEDQVLLDQAIKDGKLVRITYDERRFQVCTQDYVITKVELLP